jgi:hypothetical protein
MKDWSSDETDDPLYADGAISTRSRNGRATGRRLIAYFAGNSLDKAGRIFERAIKHNFRAGPSLAFTAQTCATDRSLSRPQGARKNMDQGNTEVERSQHLAVPFR